MVSDAWAARSGLTAILITVPELAAYTERWRSVSRSTARSHVPLTKLIPPHVTVLVPWVAEPTEADVRRLADAVTSFEPFELSFPTAGQFPNGTAWLKPEPYDAVVSLLYSVVQAFPECPPYGGEFPDPQPHLTISSSEQGGPAVVAEARAALAAAPAPRLQLTELGLWREGEDGVWRQFGAVPLGAR
jgi:2'-5' RNA ligase